MDRYVLTQIVRLEGRDFFGRYSCLTLEPARDLQDWVWNIGGLDLPITPHHMVSRPRRVALEWAGHCFNEFEHVGILRALGLRGVRIRLNKQDGWPPYDGGSFALWQAVMPHVKKSGELRPYLAHKDATATLPTDPTRYSTYLGESNYRDRLFMTCTVEFPRIAKDAYRTGYTYPHEDLRTLVRARTLGWPPSLWWAGAVASLFGWPHHKKILWPAGDPLETLDEIARHRLLDALAVLNFLAPADCYLAGGFNTVKGNHQSDLLLMQALTDAKVILLKRSAA